VRRVSGSPPGSHEKFLGLEEFVDERERLVGELERRVKSAEKLALSHSLDHKILCRISRRQPSALSLSEHEIVFEIETSTYLKSPVNVGDYLAAVNCANLQLVLLEIVSVQRADILSIVGREAPITVAPPDPSGLATPVLVAARPLTAFDYDERSGGFKEVPRPVVLPLEPQSPIFRPKPELVAKLLGLPDEGVVVGCLLTSSLLPLAEIPVKIPLKAFLQHVLIVGSTGSGKTTFIKNMVAALVAGKDYRVESGMKPTPVIFDATGEYVQLVLPPPKWERPDLDLEEEERIREGIYAGIEPPNEIVVLLPITKEELEKILNCIREAARGITGGELARKVAEKLAKDYVDEVLLKLLGENIERLEVEKVDTVEMEESTVRILETSLKIRISSREICVRVVPLALEFARAKRDLHELSPDFSTQARHFLPRIIRVLEEDIIGREFRSLEEFAASVDEKRNVLMNRYKIHRGTLDNISRCTWALVDTGIFDVSIPAGEVSISIGEPSDYGALLSSAKGIPVVVDLHRVSDAEYIIVHRLLRQIFRWKYDAYERREPTHQVIIIIDEAHRYFPSAGFGERDSLELLARQLTTIARLGRMRGLSLVFSTHLPDDVHRVILQLSNTKIAFRSEPQYLERVGIPPEYRERLANAPDRVAIIRSHIFRSHYAPVKTTPPLVGHYDLSAITLMRTSARGGSGGGS